MVRSSVFSVREAEKEMENSRRNVDEEGELVSLREGTGKGSGGMWVWKRCCNSSPETGTTFGFPNVLFSFCFFLTSLPL